MKVQMAGLGYNVTFSRVHFFENNFNTSHVKQPLVSETFNIVGLHPPHGLVSKDQVKLVVFFS